MIDNAAGLVEIWRLKGQIKNALESQGLTPTDEFMTYPSLIRSMKGLSPVNAPVIEDTIASRVQALRWAKNQLRAALRGIGVPVTERLSTYPAAIAALDIQDRPPPAMHKERLGPYRYRIHWNDPAAQPGMDYGIQVTVTSETEGAPAEDIVTYSEGAVTSFIFDLASTPPTTVQGEGVDIFIKTRMVTGTFEEWSHPRLYLFTLTGPQQVTAVERGAPAVLIRSGGPSWS